MKKILGVALCISIAQLSATTKLSWLFDNGLRTEAKIPTPGQLSKIKIENKNVGIYFGGMLKDEFFVYGNANTLRSDYHDTNDFFRHKLNLDLLINQGKHLKKKPASEAFIRLSNYVLWQKESNYTPLTIKDITIPELDGLTIAKDIPVKTFIPLIYAEQAWFKLNLDTFTDFFKNKETFFQIGYFPYFVGRGVALGHHEDLAVDYLGWQGDGGFTRFSFMPPGILFHMALNKNLAWEVYYNLWKETNASLSDTMRRTQASHLDATHAERGNNKDRNTWITKLLFAKKYKNWATLSVEPYLVYVDAPEQTIEIEADANSKLFTLGTMIDCHTNNVAFNFEIAGQIGHQNMIAIDRNQMQLTRSPVNGTLGTQFTNLRMIADGKTSTVPSEQAQVPAGADDKYSDTIYKDTFQPDSDLTYITQFSSNKNIDQQGKELTRSSVVYDKTNLAILKGHSSTPKITLQNSTVFGNERFRKDYKLDYQGFMALADISYVFPNAPFSVAASAGFISGDKYPYNDQINSTYKGFIPMRSRYRGMGVQNFLIFDRLVIPRPLNISYKDLYAHNNLKDLGNLQFFGLGGTWYPYKDKKKLALSTDVMWLWEVAHLNKWDKNGTHPNPVIEAQLARLRNTVNGIPTKFSGWESSEKASRMLGTEIDFKALYKVLDHCTFTARFVVFFPGDLYKDLDGQPNEITQRIDMQNYLHYDSLGHNVAYSFFAGLNYKF